MLCSCHIALSAVTCVFKGGCGSLAHCMNGKVTLNVGVNVMSIDNLPVMHTAPEARLQCSDGCFRPDEACAEEHQRLSSPFSMIVQHADVDTH